MPTIRHAAHRRAPALRAIAMSCTMAWRSSKRIIRPRPCGRSPSKTAAQVEGARARKDQSWIQYQNALLVAFKEVRDGFGSLTQRVDAETAQEARLRSAEKAWSLSRLRQEAGYSSALEVLDAQRSFNEAAMAVADARRARLSATVDVFKALGGGWTAP